MEYLRILRKPQRLSIRRMLEQSEPQQTKFTPMSFLKYQSKSFRRLTDYAEIEIEHVTQLSDILDDSTVTVMHAEVQKSDCLIQASVNIIEKVDAFVDVHRHESIVCFTDGATSDCEVGRGSAQ